MALDPKEGLVEYAGFSGLRNTVPLERFGLDDLSVATNVDINDAKQLRRRTGHGAAVASGALRSLWSQGPVALAVRNDTTLVQVQPNYSLTTLRSDLTPGLGMDYAAIGSRVYYSNGSETGVVQNGASRSWGLTIPTGQPAAESIGGTLPAGRYQFAVTFLRSDGQESGTLPAGLIELTAAGGVRLTSLPTTDDPDVSQLAVYFTKCNGETLFRAGRVPAGEAIFDYPHEASMQVPLTTQHLRPAPAGNLLDVFNGRVLVANAGTLRYSEPYSAELFDLRKRYDFLGALTMVGALETGAYAATRDEVFWLEGAKPEEWVRRRRLAYGAIPGAVARCSRDMVLDGQGSQPVIVFATTHGICLGLEGGEIANLTSDRFLYPIQERGAAVVRRHRGMVQAVVTMRGAETAAPAGL